MSSRSLLLLLEHVEQPAAALLLLVLLHVPEQPHARDRDRRDLLLRELEHVHRHEQDLLQLLRRVRRALQKLAQQRASVLQRRLLLFVLNLLQLLLQRQNHLLQLSILIQQQLPRVLRVLDLPLRLL